MVDKIYEYIPNLHGNHTLCYFRNDCRILKHFEITLERMTDTRKPPKTLKPLKSKLPTRPNIFSTSFSMLWAESFRDKVITTLRKNYETGTFHASSQ